MPDEPTLGEVQRVLERGLAEINARLDKVVSLDVFQAEQARVYDRITDLQTDLAEEKLARTQGDTAQQGQLDKLVTSLRWVAASIAIPTALFIANIVQGKPT